MATFNSRQVQKLFVGGLAGNTTATIGAMPAGEIGIFTPSGARVTEANAAATQKFVIVQSRGTEAPLRSGIIDKTRVRFKANARAYEASQVLVDAIGFNGTAGNIDVINDNLYKLDFNLAQELVSNHGGIYIKHAIHKSSLTATQEEIATAIAKSTLANFSREPESILIPEVLMNEAGAGAAGGLTTLNVVKGSKIAVADDAITLAVGDYIRVTAGLTSPVYKVANITPSTGTTVLVEFEYAYQGATATVAVANVIRITNAQAIVADAGVRFTGEVPSFRLGKISNRVFRWTLSMQDFGNTSVTRLQAAKEGTGTLRQVQELEWFTQGNEGDFFRMGEPRIFDSRQDANTIYDLINIQTEENKTTSITTGAVHQEITLAIPEATPTYAGPAQANGITRVLEILIFGALNGELAV